MSHSDESGVTYTDISSSFEELSDIGSPRADDHEYLMMLEDPYVEVALQAPPSPDYMPGLEEPEQAPPSPDYVPVVAPTAADQAPSAEETEPFETNEPEVTLPPQKRLGIALGPREIMRDPEREVGYGITHSWDEIVETLQGAPI
nr:hypothetical protein [Tanacetum cinerariifolium]